MPKACPYVLFVSLFRIEFFRHTSPARSGILRGRGKGVYLSAGFDADLPLVSSSEAFLISSSTSFKPCLKLFTPLPTPFISSGIFLPPKRSRITRTMTIISPVPRLNSKSIESNIVFAIY